MSSAVGNPLEHLTLSQLRQRTSSKWRAYPPDVLPAFVAEMDVELATPVVQAVDHAMAIGDTGYAIGDGYVRALGDFALARWGWDGVVPARALTVTDVMSGISEVLRLVSGPGEAVVVSCPVYQPFFNVVAHEVRRLEEARLTEEGRLDFDELEAAFIRASAHGPRPVYLLCNPHNPTGVLHTTDELAAVADLAGRHGVRVISDEIHAPIVAAGGTFVPYLSVSGEGFAVMSASKAWNLAGFKAAVVVAGEDSAGQLREMPKWLRSSPGHLGEIAHTAALREGVPWLDALLAGLDANRTLLGQLLTEHLPEVVWRPGGATYLAWLDCRALGLGDDPAATFLKRGKVALSPGPMFGAGGGGHVRLNFATSQKLLGEIVRRMATALG